MNLTVLTGDSVEQLRTLEGGSVHLCVTSPPYDKLRDWKMGWDFEGTALELFRVLCPGGVCCWNVGDSVVDGSETLTSCEQKIFFRKQAGFRIHDTMIYEKVNFGQPSSNRYHQMFEYVFVLSKGSPRAWNPIKDKKNSWAGTGTFGKNTMREAGGTMGERKRNIITEYGMRGNVWKGLTRGQEEMCQSLPHPAMMPKWLARDLILSFSNIGDTVLDCFGGSGTTGQMALETARHAILIEANPEHVSEIRASCHITPGLALA